MAWSRTDSGIKAGTSENIGVPANFSAGAVYPLEVEQWKAAKECADLLMKWKVVGSSGVFTITLSGTSNTGHPAGDTITVTVTAA